MINDLTSNCADECPCIDGPCLLTLKAGERISRIDTDYWSDKTTNPNSISGTRTLLYQISFEIVSSTQTTRTVTFTSSNYNLGYAVASSNEKFKGSYAMLGELYGFV